MRDFAAIDFETANNERTSICSVGVVIVRDGVIVDTFYSLIQPESNYYNYWCSRVHGLTREDTEDAPVFPEVWKQIEPLIEGLPLVAHNKSFDESCLKAVFRCYQMDYPDYPFYCTCVASRRAFPQLPNHQLHTVSEYCGYHLANHHHALADFEYSEYEEQDPVRGLFRKFDRLYGQTAKFVERDSQSHLAEDLDLGFDNEKPQCPYSENDFPEIQRKITNFINKRVISTEDVGLPLLTGVVQTQLLQVRMKNIVDNFIQISHFITDYVDYHDVGDWNWQIDSICIFQYVFEKSAELTYLVSKGKDTESLQYDIRDAFSYFQLSVPNEFQMKIDGAVDKIENIVMDITSFIEQNNYYLCDKDTWFRPIVFNAALEGMRFTLEQYKSMEPQKNKYYG